MPMLPILEHPYPDVLNEIGFESCITQNLLTDIVEYSLNFPSRHWALSAVTWIENGFPINNSICKRLLNISKDKYDSQQLRHKSLTQLVGGNVPAALNNHRPYATALRSAAGAGPLKKRLKEGES